MTESELDNWKGLPSIFKVDLAYPVTLNDSHNDYPLAPEQVEVNKVNKFLPNIQRKEVVHYENLKLYERLGLKITKICSGVQFEESDWLKQYTEHTCYSKG